MGQWKVGEMAELAGLSVRALHHYDRIGLLSPSKHSGAGHRLYTESDLARLQQILSLKHLGFGLDEIKELLENPSYDPREVLRMQLARLNEQIRLQEELRDRLEYLNELLSSRQEISSAQFICVIEMFRRMARNRHFSREQLDRLKNLRRQLHPEKARSLAKFWTETVVSLRKEMEKGTPPENPDIGRLATRWKELTVQLAGGDPEIVRAAEHYYGENPEHAEQAGIDRPLYAYIHQAWQIHSKKRSEAMPHEQR